MTRYRGGLMEDVHRNLYLPDLLFILEKYNFLHWGKRKKKGNLFQNYLIFLNQVYSFLKKNCKVVYLVQFSSVLLLYKMGSP